MGNRVHYNTTKQVNGEDDIGGKLSGRADMVFIRNKYQTELDNANLVIVARMNDLKNSFELLNNNRNNASKLKNNIKAHLDERISLYEELQKLLSKEQGSDHDLWNKTLESRILELKDKNISIFQKNKDSDIESMTIGSSLNYPIGILNSDIKKRYNELMNKISIKEEDIRKSKERYHSGISNYNGTLPYVEDHIQRAEAKIEAYDTIFKEGTEKLERCRYFNSIFHKLSSEKSKDEIRLVTLTHRIKQYRDRLESIKKDVSDYQNKKFIEMDY